MGSLLVLNECYSYRMEDILEFSMSWKRYSYQSQVIVGLYIKT